MPFSLADLLYGGLLPAAVAATLWTVFSRRTDSEAALRILTAAAFVAGVHAGYWLLGLGQPAPESHWEWLPWVLLLSLAGAVPAATGGRGRLLCMALVVVVAIAAAWVLVPDWSHLEASRARHRLVLASSIVVIAVGLEPLSRRIPAAKLCLVLAVVLGCTAAILALSGSLRFAQIAGCGAAALAGLSLAATLQSGAHTAAGIALTFALFAAGLMLIGRVNSFSDVPLISYILPPLAPLSLWPTAAGPRARSTGLRHWLLRMLPLLICLVAVALAAIA